LPYIAPEIIGTIVRENLESAILSAGASLMKNKCARIAAGTYVPLFVRKRVLNLV